MRRTSFLQLLGVVGMMLLAASCSTTRYVPEDELLLGSVKVRTVGDYGPSSPSLLANYVRQRPNSRWFSLFKLPLATYSLSGADTTRWLNRTLRAIGEPPVIFDSLKARESCADLRQQLKNEGFLHADVTCQLRRHGRKADVTYWLQPGEPYFVSGVTYHIGDSAIARLLRADSTRRLLRDGMRFDVSRLEEERRRITALLADSGYYRFHKEYITFRADTLRGTRLIDLHLHLSPLSPLPTPHSRYSIRNIAYASGNPSDSRLHLRRHHGGGHHVQPGRQLPRPLLPGCAPRPRLHLHPRPRRSAQAVYVGRHGGYLREVF